MIAFISLIGSTELTIVVIVIAVVIIVKLAYLFIVADLLIAITKWFRVKANNELYGNKNS